MREHVDLFSGIGGFALAAEANGLATVSFCEIDPICQAFLAKVWPGVKINDDIRSFDGNEYRGAFLLTAGPPCQPASRAGKQGGEEDDRWLWPEALRVLGEILPAWAIFENPPGIGDVGLAGILSEMGGLGYNVRVFAIPACAVGAPHRRERYWIVANSSIERRQQNSRGPSCDETENARRPKEDNNKPSGNGESPVANSSSRQRGAGPEEIGNDPGSSIAGDNPDGSSPDDRGVGYAPSGINAINEAKQKRRSKNCRSTPETGVGLADSHRPGRGDGGEPGDAISQPDASSLLAHSEGGTLGPGLRAEGSGWERGRRSRDFGFWDDAVGLPCADGKVRRAPGDSFVLVDGIPGGLLEALAEEGWPHRSILAALGNAIVPQVAEEIIRAILEAEET